MKIAIIGASRGIGKALLETVLAEDHDVTVLARYPEKIEKTHPRLRIVAGDVLNSGDVENLAKDQDVICSCIGSPITFKPVELFSKAAKNITAAVQKNPGQRYITVTGIGAGDTEGHGGFLYDKIFKPLLLKTIYEDKNREEAIVKASGIDWLIVRPAGLTNGKHTGKYRVINDLTGVTARRISRLDVADFILSQIKEPTQFGKTPLITY